MNPDNGLTRLHPTYYESPLRRFLLAFWVGTLVVGLYAGAAFAENRTIDGVGNNLTDPTLGSTYTVLLRQTPIAYADGISAPAGPDRRSAREISNAVCDQGNIEMPNSRDLTDWVWQWGQFIDHDITLSESMVPTEPFDIAVPQGDVMFDPQATGDMAILLNRTIYDPSTGSDVDNPRQQMNELTSFIDASNIYGSSAQRAAWLRTGEGGKLKTGAGNLLPFNDGSQINAGPGGASSASTDLFTSGDIRASEQTALTSVHTLFMREHNRLCDEIVAEHPDWDDEQIYQRARKIVGALEQVITYHEFLPALLGPYAPDPAEAKYDPDVDPRIANVFANACYRIGHSMLSPQIMRLDDNGDPIAEGPLYLRDAFFNPSHIIDEGGIEPLLRGLAGKSMQQIDTFVVDDIRNFLFGQPGQGGFDLASLNIQRGRDHGLPDYNTVRESFGLARKVDFADISSDPQVQQRLASVYDSVDQIDAWVGGLAEDPLPDASVGELITTVMVDQFTRLRDGDRFWYAFDDEFTDQEVAELSATRLSDVIRRNSDITNIQDNVFMARVAGPDDGSDGMGSEPTVLCGQMGMVSMLSSLLGLCGFRRLTSRRYA